MVGIAGGISSSSGLSLPKIFSDGCVLQTWDQGDARSFVYGQAAPSSDVQISVSSEVMAKPFFRSYKAIASIAGDWKVQIDGTYAADPLGRVGPHYGPYTLNVSSGSATVLVRHVRFGDVFVCAGDEAMAKPNDGPSIAKQSSPASYSQISRFVVGYARSTSPQEDVISGRWQTDGDALAAFSSVCTELALSMARLDPAGMGPGNTTGGQPIPIGLILAVDEGSLLAEWAPNNALATCHANGRTEGGGRLLDGASLRTPHGNRTLYNGMIAPLNALAVRGAVLSQGRADVSAATPAAQYAACLRTLVSGWRDAGGIGDYALVVAQSGADAGTGEAASAIRLAQEAVLPLPHDGDASAVDTAALAASYDLDGSVGGSVGGSAELGRRLALAMVYTAYSKQEPAWPVAPPALGAAEPLSPSVVRLSLTSGVGGLQLVDVSGSACGSSGGPLVQARAAGSATWTDASRLQLSRAERQGATTEALQASFEMASAAAIAQVRLGLAGRPSCFVLNANRLPPLPFVANVSAPTDAATSQPSADVKPAPPAWLPPARLPPLGFNTWNRWHCWVDESLLRRTADLMVSLGLVAAGYTYLNVDDCWQATRSAAAAGSAIVVDPVRFPSGLRAFSDYAHARGLRFGLYTSQTELTCQARPGSYGYEEQDAAAYCAADVDYLKIDSCMGAQYPLLNESWIRFRKGLDACAAARGRPFLMACSSCGVKTGGGVDGCGRWVAQGPVSCDVWRVGDDIQAHWSSILTNLEQNTVMASVQNTHPGHFNDPDMLAVGNAGLSLTEQVSHFTLWAIMGSPLLISTDLRQISADALAILTNRDLLAVNQDPLGQQGTPIALPPTRGVAFVVNRTYEVYAKPLAGQQLAVVLFNRADAAATLELDLATLPTAFTKPPLARDLWRHEELGALPRRSQYQVEGHGVVALRLRPAARSTSSKLQI